jgi:hypothetical protein
LVVCHPLFSCVCFIKLRENIFHKLYLFAKLRSDASNLFSNDTIDMKQPFFLMLGIYEEILAIVITFGGNQTVWNI